MKIFIDILTPKNCLFFQPLITKLEGEGYEVLVTARRYREVDEMVKLKGLRVEILGRHGGRSRRGKLISSTERILAMTELVDDWKPDVTLAFNSPEAARVSFGLGIPHLTVNNTPEAEAVARLCIPLASKLFTPWVIPYKIWTGYGIARKNIIKYRGLDPVAWLKNFKPREEVLEGLGLSKDDDIVVVRPEESQAAYLLDLVLDPAPLASQWIPDLLKKWEGVKIVLLCRYRDQIEAAKRRLGNRVVIPKGLVDGASLLSYAKAFIGYGGTMTAEAALLGIPTISSFPGQSYHIEKYLVKEGLIIRETDPRSILNLVLNYLEKGIDERKRKKAHKLLKEMENPIEVIAQYIKTSFKETPLP